MRATRALKSLGCQISAGRVGHVEALGILLWSRCVKPDPVQRVSGPHPVQNPPTSRAACARLDSMSVSQSQTESGGLVGSSSRALLIPPGGGGGGGRGCGCGGSALCSIPFCNSQHLGPFCAFFFFKYLRFRSLQTLAGERPSEF